MTLTVCVAAAGAHATPLVYLQVASHNEQPHVPDTPNFSAQTAIQAGDLSSVSSYKHWREALKAFAEMCVARGLKYNCQCEWNFLEGVRKWEVTPATALPGITSNTGGKNVLKYLYDLGVEIDPHSHEGQGYTYADVAWLIGQCGVPAAPVVGGHTLDPITHEATNFARFADMNGVAATKYPALAPNWHPTMLMGGASANHVNDPHVAGLWRPTSGTAYYTHSPSGPLVSIGGWNEDLFETDHLIRRLASGELPSAGKMWTAGLVLNHRDFNDDTYRNSTARMVLDTLKRWQDEGRIQTMNYLEAKALWESPTDFNSQPSLYQRPDDNVSFSLNWQDFYYQAKSAASLHALLTLHEMNRVPVDVFFTTWQSDIIAQQYPDLFGRLQSSALVAQSYHVRAPKPYAEDFEWGELRSAGTSGARRTQIITEYESNALDLVTGTPVVGTAGGYVNLTSRQGYSPLTVGALPATSPVNLTSTVNNVFKSLGAKMLVKHDPPVNIGSRESTSQLLQRPEHFDWKLITLWDATLPDYDPARNLTGALASARATVASGGFAPWFVGIKLHDNDLFTDQSEWTLVWPNYNSASWDLSRHANLLSAAEQAARLVAYTAIVAEVSAQRTQLNILNSFDTISLMQDPQVRPIGLSRTAFDETGVTGNVLAELTGGGELSGQAVSYALVSGAGADDNADFTLSGSDLLSARALDFETRSTRRLRVRWNWIDPLDGVTVLGSGERALTVVLNNITSDDDDGDGATEADENIAGTNPLDASSVFRVSSITRSSSSGAVDVTFPSVSGRYYTLQSSVDLVGWSNEDEPGVIDVPGLGGPMSLRDVNPAGARKFYRVLVGTSNVREPRKHGDTAPWLQRQRLMK